MTTTCDKCGKELDTTDAFYPGMQTMCLGCMKELGAIEQKIGNTWYAKKPMIRLITPPEFYGAFLKLFGYDAWEATKERIGR
jgi:hypothetical protein